MYKRFFELAVPAVMLAAIGCTEGTRGGPGAATTPQPQTANRPTYKDTDQTFTVSVPVLRTDIKQGETKEIKIGISRGKEFDQDVTLQLSGLPQGVTTEPEQAVIKKSDKDVGVRLSAADDAALGDFTVKIMAHPTLGIDATNDLPISVSKKN